MIADVRKTQRKRTLLSRRIVSEIFAFTVVLFFLPVDGGAYQDFLEKLADASHLPLFLAFAILLDYLLQSAIPRPQLRKFFVFILGLGLAGGIEIIQPYFDRSESIEDYQTGVLGLLFGISALAFWESKRGRLCWTLLTLSLFLELAILLRPAKDTWDALQWQNQHFPQLALFESSQEIALWHPALEKHFASDPEESFSPLKEQTPMSDEGETPRYSLSVQTVPNRYSGVQLSLHRMDISAFGELTLKVYSPVSEIPFWIRIDDTNNCEQLEDRFNREFLLSKGWNEISIPIEDIQKGPVKRELNIHSLERILFFIEPEKFIPHFRIAELRLH